MNVLFLNSPIIKKRHDNLQIIKPHLRTSIASLAAYLRKNNHEVRIIDPVAEKYSVEKILDLIKKAKFDYVAFSSYTEEINDFADLADKIKEQASNVYIIVGGYHLTALPEETLHEFSSIDIGVIGEGEITLNEIINGKSLGDIHGIVYRAQEGKIIKTPEREPIKSLDDLPFPAWDLYNLELYNNELSVDILRSCPFTCSYCFRAMGKTVRHKSVKRVIEEIKFNINNYGVTTFSFFSGGTFPLNKKYSLELLNEIIENNLKIRWYASTRFQVLDEELLTAMKKSGCIFIGLGVESGDDNLLKSSGKEVSVSKIKNILITCHKLKIPTDVYFIIGFPDETKTTLNNTLKFVKEIRKYTTLANFAILTPFPGTKIFELALSGEGNISLKTKDWSKYGKQAGLALHHNTLTEKELKYYQFKLYFTYYIFSLRKIITNFNLYKDMGIFSFKRIFELLKRLTFKK